MRASSGGPCCHCGTSITPCWRKGPPEKPTLCNACGSRYLVKGDLVGYYPGARRSAARSDASMPHITKSGPRKAMSTATGSKRKSQDVDRYEGQAQLMYNNYEAMETLRYALFCTGPTSAMAAARTASDDSTDHGDQEECFHKDYQQFLDASSDDCQEPMGEVKAMSAAHAPAAANEPEVRPAMFHRRPRKQLRPVACSC